MTANAMCCIPGPARRRYGRKSPCTILRQSVHDISCPLCREKYGNTNGKNQELESEPLVKEFFEGMPVSEQKVERIIWLVTHHHTYTNIDGIDYQILIEADFLVNASESNFSKVSIENAKSRIFRTAAGCRLLESIFLREE